MIKVEPISKEKVIRRRVEEVDNSIIEMLNEIILENCKIYGRVDINKKLLRKKCEKFNVDIEELFNHRQAIYHIYCERHINITFDYDNSEIDINLVY